MTNCHLMETQNLVISFDYSWFLVKNLAYAECLIMKFHYRNSSTNWVIKAEKSTKTSWHFINFLEDMRTRKFAFEIFWPLINLISAPNILRLMECWFQQQVFFGTSMYESTQRPTHHCTVLCMQIYGHCLYLFISISKLAKQKGSGPIMDGVKGRGLEP